MVQNFQLQQNTHGKESMELGSSRRNNNSHHNSVVPKDRKVITGTYILLLLSGQTVSGILGKLYYYKGGHSDWMASLVQTLGFPLLMIPFMFFISQENENKLVSKGTGKIEEPPTLLVRAKLYPLLGVLVAAISILDNFGFRHLPFPMYSLIWASQLPFNTVFSYFLNSEKLTPSTINSLVLLTISPILLVFGDDYNSTFSKGKYALGFLCTVVASAVSALLFSLTELAVQKLLKQRTFLLIVEMIIYSSAVASCVNSIGLFASGEWKGLSKEMGEFELGKWSYIMTLVGIAISIQVFNIGSTGLIFEVSSLYSNVISTLGLPITTLLEVFVFQEKLNGVKIVAMLLTIWGFVSDLYQTHLDKKKSEIPVENEVSESRFKILIQKKIIHILNWIGYC